MTAYVAPAPTDALEFVKFLDFLQGREKHALGFLPYKALEQAIGLGRVLLCFENEEPAGYVIHGPPKDETKIYQVVVCNDVRRIEHGTALVEAVTIRANNSFAQRLTLHCAQDLEANQFWQQLGFTHTGTRCRRKDGKRHQNKYEIVLPGQALAKIKAETERKEITAQLEKDGLTNLRNLLIKSDHRHEKLSMRRKTKTEHEIYS